MFSKRINQFLFFTFLFFILSCSKSSNNAIPNDHGEVNLVKSYNFFETQGEVAPYISNNPFSEALSRCVYAIKDTDSCTPNELPLLGMNQKEITVEDILSRTLVSHQFLGDSFKEILMILPKDLLPMFGSVNAIVISNKINPSFFYRKSAAIYLSANLFWRNQEEKKISTIAVDKREGMGFELQFLFDYNYLINGKSIFELNSTKKSERSYDVLKYSVARLLFHELTHANDYYAKNFYSSADFDNTKTFAAISYDHYVNKGLVSSRLPSYANSKLMDRIVAITNDGETSTDEDLLITPKDVSDEFKKDVVNDDYSYVTQLEDAAMLMEETLIRMIILLGLLNGDKNQELWFQTLESEPILS